MRLNELMSGHTSFKIGGPADILVLPESIEQLREVLKVVKETVVPLTLLGNGSNVLVRDKGIRGIVIKLGNMLRHFYEAEDLLVFGSGYSLALASYKAMECGRTGMEFAVGIPGSIGGAVYMNAGAYDGEMQNIVNCVKVMDLQGNERVLTAEELNFGYRKPVYRTVDLCYRSNFKMPSGNKDEIKSKMDDFSHRRISKQR